MSGGLRFDEETSRKVEAVYQTPDVIAQRLQVLKAMGLRAGEQVLDIGSGPGLLAYDMAASVGRDCRVFGIDTSEDMLTMSTTRCADNLGRNSRKLMQLNCPIRMTVSTPPYRLKFTNTLRMFQRRSQSYIE